MKKKKKANPLLLLGACIVVIILGVFAGFSIAKMAGDLTKQGESIQ